MTSPGADPTNGSNQGRPEEYTSNSSILELLGFAQTTKTTPNGIAPHELVYSPDANDDSNKRYYGVTPPVAYTYYPNINTAPQPLPEGSAYYPPPPPPHGTGDNNTPGGVGNLPPPEVARFIPCRYFPACRYGSSCLFAHPQAPYFQGSLPPPAQYAPSYDQMSPQPYAPNYYAVLPPSFQPANGAHHMAPLSPPPASHITHGRSPEVISPVQPHFVPNGIPTSPYGPMSPSAYTHPGQVPVPMTIPSLPPLQHQSSLPPPTPQSPSNMYPSPPPTGPPFIVQDTINQYSTLQPTNATPPYHNLNGDTKQPSSQSDTYGSGPAHPNHRDGAPHNRRGTARRGSFGGSRKPPCLFFPAGRCKNGYVLTIASIPAQITYFRCLVLPVMIVVSLTLPQMDLDPIMCPTMVVEAPCDRVKLMEMGSQLSKKRSQICLSERLVLHSVTWHTHILMSKPGAPATAERC